MCGYLLYICRYLHRLTMFVDHGWKVDTDFSIHELWDTEKMGTSANSVQLLYIPVAAVFAAAILQNKFEVLTCSFSLQS